MAAPAEVEPGVGSIDGQIKHCGESMRITSRRTRWTGRPGEGAQIETAEMLCQACDASATLMVTEPC